LAQNVKAISRTQKGYQSYTILSGARVDKD
jgi:hypothetical protein